MPTDKPMLTAKEVEVCRSVPDFATEYALFQSLNTIDAAVTLLRRQDEAYGKIDSNDWYAEHYSLVEDIEAFLQQFDGNGNGGEPIELTDRNLAVMQELPKYNRHCPECQSSIIATDSRCYHCEGVAATTKAAQVAAIRARLGDIAAGAECTESPKLLIDAAICEAVRRNWSLDVFSRFTQKGELSITLDSLAAWLWEQSHGRHPKNNFHDSALSS